MKTLIVIPTYNEAQNIANLIDEINDILRGYDFSVLVVDDSSPDGTYDIVCGMKNKFQNIHTILRSGKNGLASAYIEGFKYGLNMDFDAFIEMDADFSHKPEYLPEMFKLLADNDLVIGSRNIKGGGVLGWSILRKLISKGGSFYSSFILNCPIHDLTGGFNGWKKDILFKINLDSIISKGYSFQIEMKYKAFKNKAKICEFPIIFQDRKHGVSKMNKAIFVEALFNVLKIRFGA